FGAGRGGEGETPGRIAVTATTTDGATVSLDGAVRGLARIEGRLGLDRYTLASVPAWLGQAPLAELHATLELDGDYVLTEPLGAARFEMNGARITLADVGVAARNGVGARAEQLAGTAAIAVAAADGGSAVGNARLDFG